MLESARPQITTLAAAMPTKEKLQVKGVTCHMPELQFHTQFLCHMVKDKVCKQNYYYKKKKSRNVYLGHLCNHFHQSRLCIADHLDIISVIMISFNKDKFILKWYLLQCWCCYLPDLHLEKQQLLQI